MILRNLQFDYSYTLPIHNNIERHLIDGFILQNLVNSKAFLQCHGINLILYSFKKLYQCLTIA